uniref:Uncharacterized protein n=1 Tax=Gadus morhua TaxID=8049 RepID=A0A8C5BMB3_GADMO
RYTIYISIYFESPLEHIINARFNHVWHDVTSVIILVFLKYKSACRLHETTYCLNSLVRRIQCYSFSKPNPQFPSFFLSLAVLTHRSEVHTPTAARQSRGLATGGGSECVCAIACLYLLWKRERRRRHTELLAVILHNYIILYTIIYRAPGVANGNNHFLLHAAVHPGLHALTSRDTSHIFDISPSPSRKL